MISSLFTDATLFEIAVLALTHIGAGLLGYRLHAYRRKRPNTLEANTPGIGRYQEYKAKRRK